MARVTVLGLGAMGSRMAINLLKAGHQVTVYNRTIERAEPLRAQGAIVAGSPREAAQGSEFVISIVRDDIAAREIWLDGGALDGLGSDAVAIESSTVSPEWVKELDAAVRATGAHFLSAPVVGSRPQAEAGQLIYFVAGDEGVARRAQPIFEHLGTAWNYVGAVENASVFKLAVNSLLAIQVAAVSELLAFLKQSGIEEKRAGEILSSLPTISPAAKGALALTLARNFEPLFTVDLIDKDLIYALGQAQNTHSTLPVTAAAHGVFEYAIERGLAQENNNAVYKLYDKSL